jgi:hypothetical protein
MSQSLVSLIGSLVAFSKRERNAEFCSRLRSFDLSSGFISRISNASFWDALFDADTLSYLERGGQMKSLLLSGRGRLLLGFLRGLSRLLWGAPVQNRSSRL